jgi:MFS family permease
MVVDLNTTMDRLSIGESAQLSGLATGCFILVPFAVKYGRRPIYILSVALMAGGSWWTSRVQSYPELMVVNFITGMAGSINETTVQMTVRWIKVALPRPPSQLIAEL